MSQSLRSTPVITSPGATSLPAPPRSSAEKILPLADLVDTLHAIRGARTVVHCHGVFDLLHIGHIKHLESARRLGDILVVTLTPNRFVNKGPGRPAFDETLRAQALAALACVDLVAINDAPSAVEIIKKLKPDVFVKGSEFRQGQDLSGHINIEEAAVRGVGGRVEFTDDEVFSSSHLINRHLSMLAPVTRAYLDGFVQRFSTDQVLGYLGDAASLSALVVGEAIIDEYVYCQAIGKSSKEPVLTVRQASCERFAGGILAVGNHVAAFAGKTSLLTMLGRSEPGDDLIPTQLNPSISFNPIYRDHGPTILKRRFIDEYFFQKLFEVYDLNDSPLQGDEDDRLCQTLEAQIEQHDVVIVVDFGHGMISPRAVDLLARRSRLLVINAQSNAGNLGYHTLSKYPRADLVCVAENEMRLDNRDRHGDLRPMLENVSHRLGCPRVVVTRGSRGCVGFDRDAGFVDVPAVAENVKDRMGAGDTFISVAGLCAAQRAPMEVLGLLGNVAAAQAVATVGHRRYLDKTSLMKHVQCLLK